MPNTHLANADAAVHFDSQPRQSRDATAVGEQSNPPSGLNIEFWVNGPFSDPNNVFVNDLDPAKLVEVELKLLFDGLDFDQQILINDETSCWASNTTLSRSRPPAPDSPATRTIQPIR